MGFDVETVESRQNFLRLRLGNPRMAAGIACSRVCIPGERVALLSNDQSGDRSAGQFAGLLALARMCPRPDRDVMPVFENSR